MIVRDEAPLLPTCLRASQGCFDELCVVDTGSKDDTCRIAHEFGAKIAHHTWRDDFSEARNQSLKLATKPWIIFLDADEIIDAQAVAAVRSSSQDPGLGAASLCITNALNHGHVRQNHLLRMFRRDTSIFFRHKIHEDVTWAVAPYLRRCGLKFRRLAGQVHHLGYSPEITCKKNKKLRDSAILRACVEANDRDLYSWFKLGELARFHRDHRLWCFAAAGARRALAAGALAPESMGHFAGELIVLIAQEAQLRQVGDEQTYRWLTRYKMLFPLDVVLQFYLGQTAEKLGYLDEAIQAYHLCLTLEGRTVNRQLASVRPCLGLARVYLAQNNTIKAKAYIDHALQAAPQDPEALLAYFSLAAQAGAAEFSEKKNNYCLRFGASEQANAACIDAQKMIDTGLTSPRAATDVAFLDASAALPSRAKNQ